MCQSAVEQSTEPHIAPDGDINEVRNDKSVIILIKDFFLKVPVVKTFLGMFQSQSFYF